MTATANTAPLGERVAAELRELLRLGGPLLANNRSASPPSDAETSVAPKRRGRQADLSEERFSVVARRWHAGEDPRTVLSDPRVRRG